MQALGLDPSMSGFGWCIHDPDATGRNRVVKKGRWKTSARDLFLRRYMLLRELVLTLLREFPEVEIVGVESPPFGETWSEGLYGLFLFVNEAIYTSRRDVVHFDPATVKLLAKEDPSSRQGRMFKADMTSLARADTGISRWNADEADAYHIARSAARFQLFTSGLIDEDVLTPAERHVFLRSTSATGRVLGQGVTLRENDRFFRFSKLEDV